MDNIQKYFYMICFTGYLREQAKLAIDSATEEEKKAFALKGGKCKTKLIFLDIKILNFLFNIKIVSTPAENLKLNKTFVQWMDEHANFRQICEDGKGKTSFSKSKFNTIQNSFAILLGSMAENA